MFKKLNLYTFLTFVIYPMLFMGAFVLNKNSEVVNEVYKLKGDSLLYIPFDIKQTEGDLLLISL